MAHVLFVTTHYAPEKTAQAVRISETALQLVRRGYQVTALTTFPDYAGVPDRNRWHYCEWLDGVHVVRVRSYSSRRAIRGAIRGAISQISFGFLAPLLGRREIGRPDVMIVESPPLSDMLAAESIARRLPCPLIVRVASLWPERRLPDNFLFHWWARRLEQSICQRAAAIGAATEKMCATLIQRGLDEKRVFLCTDGIDTAKFYPLSRTLAREKLGWDGCFTLLYVENSDLTQELPTVLDAAEALLTYADIRFVLAGEAAVREDWQAEAQRRHLTNVTFFLKPPHDSMRLLLSAADACLVALDTIEGALPPTLFEAMACVRAILLAGDGEMRRLVEQEAALYVEPGNASALVEAVLYLRKYPEIAHMLGIQGRALVEDRFERDIVTTTLEKQIMRLLQN